MTCNSGDALLCSVASDTADMLVVACSVSRVAESNIVGNTSTVMPRSIDDINPRCVASGMDVISMFGYEPVRPVLPHLLQ